jgi:hypothetical protein
MARMPKKMLRELKAARESATMESFSAGFPGDKVIVSPHTGGSVTCHPTTFIRESTRIYRQSWILARLDRVIAWAEEG